MTEFDKWQSGESFDSAQLWAEMEDSFVDTLLDDLTKDSEIKAKSLSTFVSPAPFLHTKSLDYFVKARGQPCLRGETAKQSGCIPKSKLPRRDRKPPGTVERFNPKPELEEENPDSLYLVDIDPSWRPSWQKKIKDSQAFAQNMFKKFGEGGSLSKEEIAQMPKMLKGLHSKSISQLYKKIMGMKGMGYKKTQINDLIDYAKKKVADGVPPEPKPKVERNDVGLPKGKKPKAIIAPNLSSEDYKIGIKNVFGKELGDDVLGAITNAVDNANLAVDYNKYNNTLAIHWVGEGVSAYRTIGKKPDGKLYIHNDYFRIKDNSPHKAKGYEFFLNQVLALQESGVSFIETHAAGSATDSMNGYYTWPRFGYDGTIQNKSFVKLPIELQQKMGNSRSVLDLMELPGGKEAWKLHGSDIYDAKFDLSDGSRSMKVLESYVKEREQRDK